MDKNSSLIHQILISNLTFLNFSEKTILWKKLDSSTKDVVPFIEEIASFVQKKASSRVIWDEKNALLEAERTSLLLERLGIECLLYSDENYPKLLLETDDPPFMLFYRGNAGLLKESCISVVGTRKVTSSGMKAAKQFAFDAACDGKVIVSGLAFGVDVNAHKGAMEAYLEEKTVQCRTICVLPGGIDEIIPKSHKAFASKVLSSGGLLISEYGPGVPAEKWRFIQRNRIVAGLSSGTIVIEAPPGSGAMITAEMALNYNRDLVFHKAAFSQQANAIAKMVHLNLAAKSGQAAQKKIERDPLRFINDGAPVVESYDDYCRCLAELPGTRITNLEEQRLLF